MAVYENLRLLIAEVSAQVASLQEYLLNPSVPSEQARRLLDRAGYSVNLKRRIHAYCLQPPTGDDLNAVATLSLQTLARELEHIARLCRECVLEADRMQQRTRLRPKRYAPLLQAVLLGLDCIEEAIEQKDTDIALQVGQAEALVSDRYQQLTSRYTSDLKREERRGDIVHALFVARSVKEMGDALLVISEALISANLGQPIDTGRYHSLTAAVEHLQPGKGDTLQVASVAETRSGSDITGISDGADEPVAIFKDGLKRKVKEERQGVQSWERVFPGLAPRILSYHKRGRSAALLIEHLDGMTLERIAREGSSALLSEALRQLTRTLKSVWKATRTDKPIAAGFIHQLEGRLADVYGLHPEFRQAGSRIGALRLMSFDALMERASALEARLKPPYSVHIHGDFNLDNILYDPRQQQINFIDLHRSQYMDYVQDVSVFMVSGYRLQAMAPGRRRRALAMIVDFYRFAARRARKEGDSSFELRLALGLARSFATSTRFIVDPALSQAMFLRCRYLLERAVQADPERARDFRIPMEDIFVG